MAKVVKDTARSRTAVGKVISSKMDKTVVVLVERLVKHPMYGKYIRRTTKMAAHDEKKAAKEGSVVKIMESKPISKNKTWTLVEILS